MDLKANHRFLKGNGCLSIADFWNAHCNYILLFNFQKAMLETEKNENNKNNMGIVKSIYNLNFQPK